MSSFLKKLFNPKNRALIIIIILLCVALCSFLYLKDKLLKQEPATEAFLPKISDLDYYDSIAYAKERVFNFSDGSEFKIYRFVFGNNIPTGKVYTKTIELLGDDIIIKWQNYEEATPKWEVVSDITNIPKTTLFIETTKENMVLSIPALYHNRFEYKTIESIPSLERACTIEEKEGGYTIYLEYQADKDTVGEAWYYKTTEPLTDWSPSLEKVLLSQDLHNDRRFCFDGYYFRTYTTYKPYSENGFFRNAANFTGDHLIRNESLGSIRNIGYAMTKICALNQNSKGFWETGPMSSWLYADYGIEYDFYDTRFSTDFARSLLVGYNTYEDDEFLTRAVKYAGFLLDFAEKEGYKLDDGALLVPDYWSASMITKPHVSLNHQLAELNFLLELFIITDNTKYYDGAKSMLKGIEFTENEWNMDDNNLEYAIFYDESVNIMRDYPYLTYNDLYETKTLLNSLGESSMAIERLMASKKAWMDENGVEGYKGWSNIQQRGD